MLQAASHPFITGQPHPRDLGALTIADDQLTNDRYTRQLQAMQLQHHQDQQEAERKVAQQMRHHVRYFVRLQTESWVAGSRVGTELLERGKRLTAGFGSLWESCRLSRRLSRVES